MPLATLLREELVAGNGVGAIDPGHPAPPVGVCVLLAGPAVTLAAVPAATLGSRGLVRRCWSGDPQRTGWTDATGHCFLMEPDLEAPAVPVVAAAPAVVDEERLLRERASACFSSAAMGAWDASRAMNFERWHDGVGYDLAALARMTDAERASVEVSLLTGLKDWRDVQALAWLDTPRTRAALRVTLAEGPAALRQAVRQHAPHIAAARRPGRTGR